MKNITELSKENNIKFSIIVPVYRVEKELPRCVDSLLKQTYSNIEVILVDDESPDRCPMLCDFYANQDKRVKVIHKKNGGLSDARNAGLKQATGEYILFVDSDDSITTNACQRFEQIISSCKADIVVGEAIEFWESKSNAIVHTNLKQEINYSPKEYLMRVIQAREWFAMSWLNCYCREFLIKNDLWFAKGMLHEDMQILPHLFLAAREIRYMQGPFYNYYRREDSITLKQNKSQNWNSLFIIYTQWKKCFDQVKDLRLKKTLYGILIKQYLYGCRECSYSTRKLPNGFSLSFLLRYSLNFRERIKGLIYIIAPRVYIHL